LLERLGLKDNVGKGAIGTTVLRRVLRPQGLGQFQVPDDSSLKL